MLKEQEIQLSEEHRTEAAFLIDPAIALMGLELQLLNIGFSKKIAYSAFEGYERFSWETEKKLPDKHMDSCICWVEFLDAQMAFSKYQKKASGAGRFSPS
jgi:hypothetical protein